MSYVTFGLGDRTLALPLSAVEAVERPGRFTAVPFAAPWLRGVTAVRGAVMSVVDLGRFTGGAPAGLTPSARLLVTRAGAMRAALLVDRVGAIAAAPDVEILDPDTLLSADAFANYQLPEERGAN
ncbi:MAG TPA: chemotaxis protein CheW [Chloroflexota bacterium]|nr:chemotaxis protein CheW [Chloroflexota bacterium]